MQRKRVYRRSCPLGCLLGFCWHYLCISRFIPWHLKLWKLRIGTEEGGSGWWGSTKAEFQPSLLVLPQQVPPFEASVKPLSCSYLSASHLYLRPLEASRTTSKPCWFEQCPLLYLLVIRLLHMLTKVTRWARGNCTLTSLLAS